MATAPTVSEESEADPGFPLPSSPVRGILRINPENEGILEANRFPSGFCSERRGEENVRISPCACGEGMVR